jgi:phosphohistidine phosphatase
VRARDTARLACEALNVEPRRTTASRPGSTAATRSPSSTGSTTTPAVLAVGHEPDFSQIVHDLTGARVDFKKGGIAAIRLERRRGTLLVLMRPRELESLAVS